MESDWRVGRTWREERRLRRHHRLSQLIRSRQRLLLHPAVYYGVHPSSESVSTVTGGSSLLERMGVATEEVRQVQEWVGRDRKDEGIGGERRRWSEWWARGLSLPEGMEVGKLREVLDMNGGITERDWFIGKDIVGVRRMREGRNLVSREDKDERNGSSDNIGDRRAGESEKEEEEEEEEEDGPVLRSRRGRKKLKRLSAFEEKEARAIKDGLKSRCCLCPPPVLFDGKELEGELLGPFIHRRGTKKLFVHFDCGCWAPLIFSDPATGILRKVPDEYERGKLLKCAGCGTKGATIGCYVQKCKKSFHLRCLKPGVARKVCQYSVAFCARHAHLASTNSYQIIMKAGVDFSLINLKRLMLSDCTWGMDAPHSKYTMLKIRETEVIFSKNWKCTSLHNFDNNAWMVFSARRKRGVDRHDTLSVFDRPILIRMSAYRVADGSLARKTLRLRQFRLGSSDVPWSTKYSKIFLLRNFRRVRRRLAGLKLSWGAAKRESNELIKSLTI